MCTTCGCGAGEIRVEGVVLEGHEHHHSHELGHGYSAQAHSHAHGDDHDHDHAHAHGHVHGRTQPHAIFLDHQQFTPLPARASAGSARIVQLERDILEKNNGFAQENRALFARRGVQALNLVSSPGAGKTTLLVKTIERLRNERPVAVIEGDQETALDAERIRATGVPALQINTGKGCHLDAHMVGHALERLPLPPGSLLLIENVGNLVCPASFDLGEAAKVVVLSVTEGEDKPLKYPDMFQAASLMLLNKCDLLPYLNFDVDAALAHARRVNPGLDILQISATSGQGMQDWLDWIERHRPGVNVAAPAASTASSRNR